MSSSSRPHPRTLVQPHGRSGCVAQGCARRAVSRSVLCACDLYTRSRGLSSGSGLVPFTSRRSLTIGDARLTSHVERRPTDGTASALGACQVGTLSRWHEWRSRHQILKSPSVTPAPLPATALPPARPPQGLGHGQPAPGLAASGGFPMGPPPPSAQGRGSAHLGSFVPPSGRGGGNGVRHFFCPPPDRCSPSRAFRSARASSWVPTVQYPSCRLR